MDLVLDITIAVITVVMLAFFIKVMNKESDKEIKQLEEINKRKFHV